jgi:ABC-type lipoprotein release transport system permease subunit
MCLRNLLKRKLRTILTMLGVVIGTVAIVVTVSLGLAVEARFEQVIAGMGDATIITVHDATNWWFPEGEEPEIAELDSAAARAFENIPGVTAVLPVIRAGEIYFRSGNYVISWIDVMGVRPQAMAALGYEVSEGRLLQEGNNLEVVFGAFAEMRFAHINDGWSDRSWRAALGEEVDTYVDVFNDRILMSTDWNFIFGSETTEEDRGSGDDGPQRAARPMAIDVVGVLEQRGDRERGNWDMADEAIFMDIEMVQRLRVEAQRQQQQDGMRWLDVDEGGWGRINASANVIQDMTYNTIFVRAADINVVSEVHEEITEMGYMANYPGDWLNQTREMMATQQQMLMAVGAVSLFVAAIAIANTMVMSTYERTREIGVMKVIGASLSDIRRLFLLEAAMIGFFGGIFGVAFSYLMSYILNNHVHMEFMGGMMDWMMADIDAQLSLITPWLSGLALGFTAVIGLISGYFPARRATRLSALSAIRTD